jgi:hypothetical protein
MPGTDGSARDDGFSRYEDIFHHDVIGARTAHADRVPVVLDLDTLALHRQREMQHLRSVLADEDGAGHEQVGTGSAADETLVCIDAVAALDFDGLAVRGQPVVGAGTGNHKFTAGYLAERAGRFLVTPQVLEDVHADRMTVHGEGEPRRTAVTAQLPHYGADFRLRCTAAAKFFRDARGEQALFPEVVVIGRNEFAVGIELCGACRERRSEFICDGDPVARSA